MKTSIKTLLFSLLLAVAPTAVFAQQVEPVSIENEFYRAKVQSAEEIAPLQGEQAVQRLELELKSGDKDGETISIDHPISEEEPGRIFETGDTVVVVESTAGGTTTFFVADHYRLPALFLIFAIFLVVALVFARKIAAFSLAGLAFSILVLGMFIVPQLADGKSPLLIGGTGIVVIAVVSFYVAHGFHRRTTLALSGTLVAIAIAAVLSTVFVLFAQLFGTGSQEAYHLQTIFEGDLELRGILMVGIIIGALGVLDDVTIAMSTTIQELKNANQNLNMKQLYTRAMRVGREHIASMINTLVLAYAGAALPLFLVFSLDPQPFWVTLNSQFLAEEIIRSLVGSAALVLAVPITAFLAARSYGKNAPAQQASRDTNTASPAENSSPDSGHLSQ